LARKPAGQIPTELKLASMLRSVHSDEYADCCLCCIALALIGALGMEMGRSRLGVPQQMLRVVSRYVEKKNDLSAAARTARGSLAIQLVAP
jgi:hypothetical protein